MHEVDPKAISVKVGKQLRGLRIARGLSIREVAKATGMHPPIISRVELGTYMPRLDTILRIAVALQVTLSEVTSVLDTEAYDESEFG